MSALWEHLGFCSRRLCSTCVCTVPFVNDDVKMCVINDLFYLVLLSVPERGTLQFSARICAFDSLLVLSIFAVFILWLCYWIHVDLLIKSLSLLGEPGIW